MKYRKLGKNGPTVSAIGLGAGSATTNFGERDDAVQIETMQRAIDLGVTFFDTADRYMKGRHERLLGQALRGRRDRAILATKFGNFDLPDGKKGYNGKPAYVREACDASLANLGLDHIDLYYLHTPTMTDAPFEEIIDTLVGMRQDGLIRHIGLSNVSAEQLRIAMSITDIAAVTVHYSVAVRLGAAVRQVAQDAGIVFSPYHPGAVPRGHEGEPFHAAIDPIAEKYDATAQQIALAWQLHRTEQALPIPGTTSTQHLEENLAAAHISLTPDEVDAITALAPEED
jgi:pyridoxine 4-dehydrogenase